jgi:hypothetical protein
MGKFRGRILKEIPILNNEKANVLEVELYYSKGGINYFTSCNERRGFYVSVSPYQIRKYDIGSSRGYTAFTGIKQFIKEKVKFSQKDLDTLIIDEDTINNMIKHVVEKNNLVLEN